MKAKLLWVIGGVIVVVAGVAVFVLTRGGDPAPTATSDPQNIQTGTEADAGATKTACDLYTKEVAQEIFGASARKVDLPAAAQVSTETVSVTNCSYDNGSEDPKLIQSSSVLVRGAKKSSSFTDNKFGFDNNKTLDAQGGTSGTPTLLTGLGEEAYISDLYSQVNILVDGGKYWIIVQAGDNDPVLSEKLARALVKNL